MLSIIPTENHSGKPQKQYMLWADHDNHRITTLVVTDGTKVWRNAAPIDYSHRPVSRNKEGETTYMNALICAVTFTKTEVDFEYFCSEKEPNYLNLDIKQQVTDTSMKILLTVKLQREATTSASPQLRLLEQISNTMQENLSRSRGIVEINTQYEAMINDLLQDLHKFERFKNKIQDEIVEKTSILFNVKRREIKDLHEIIAAYEAATEGHNLNIPYPGSER
jgi:hypothetical protein